MAKHHHTKIRARHVYVDLIPWLPVFLVLGNDLVVEHKDAPKTPGWCEESWGRG